MCSSIEATYTESPTMAGALSMPSLAVNFQSVSRLSAKGCGAIPSATGCRGREAIRGLGLAAKEERVRRNQEDRQAVHVGTFLD